VTAATPDQAEEFPAGDATPLGLDVAVDPALAAPAPGEDNPERLAEALGLTFRNIDLLRQALTHRSVVHDWAGAVTGLPAPRSNERLEFLGDAVLGLIVAEDLYARFPEATEGDLTKRRVALVRAEQLVRWAREIDLGDYLYLGQGERITEGARDRMLAGAFEALVGAIALDRGMREARRFLRRFLRRDRDRILAEHEHANPKGRLQEVLQERFRLAPAYRILRIDGPAHARVFTAEVALGGRPLATGIGATKRDAEQAAALAALAALPPSPGGDGDPLDPPALSNAGMQR
jgi:ribonuclease-3